MVVFTICEAYLIGFSCAVINDGTIVIMAAFMTAAIVLALTLYAVFTKTDFTACGGIICVIGAAFLMFGLFSFLFGPTLHLIYCIIGVVIFGVYLIFDTQYIVGGKNRRFTIDKEDYIIGAIILYLDIINIFMYLLQILAALKGDSN